jgi:molybdopterin molybdotransferase
MAQLSDDCFAFGGKLMSVDECAMLIRANIVCAVGVESVPLSQADGRILAHDLVAASDLPPFDNSAVDGYAVRHADLEPGMKTRMALAGRVAAGAAAPSLGQAQAMRIFTGAPMPEGADTVFMQEDVEREGTYVILPPGLKCGANRRLAGEDIARAEVALTSGRRLGPPELALAAAMGTDTLPMRKKLIIGVFSTGDELTEPGQKLAVAKIHDANRPMLCAMAARLGAVVLDLGILRDEAGPLSDALAEAATRCDMILTSGGVSAGEEDHVKAAVERVGKLDFWRIAIKPGRPVAMGVVKGVPIVGLPGNPVAAMVTFAMVVRPLAAQLGGAEPPRLMRMPVRSAFNYRKKPGRREYVRVSLAEGADGMLDAHKYAREGAGVITSMTATDGLLEVGDERTLLEPGDMVSFLSWKELM